jgi:hypothetical protein
LCITSDERGDDRMGELLTARASVCPACGSIDTEPDEFKMRETDAEQTCHCRACGMRYVNVYKLSNQVAPTRQ